MMSMSIRIKMDDYIANMHVLHYMTGQNDELRGREIEDFIHQY